MARGSSRRSGRCLQDLARRGMLVLTRPHHSQMHGPRRARLLPVGTALYDFSLVDPDNRRPVDYGERLDVIGRDTADPPNCSSIGRTAPSSCRVASDLLDDRRAHASFYAEGRLRAADGHRRDLESGGRVRAPPGQERALAVLVPRLSASEKANAVLPRGRGVLGGNDGRSASRELARHLRRSDARH